MTSTASRPIINADLVALDVDAGADKEAVIGALAGRLAAAGRAADADGLIAAAMAREAQSATGLPGGIAIPHCRSPHVDTASIGFARLQPPVDFGAPDGPADLAFLIAAPEGGGAEHMKLLSSLARALVRKEFVAVAARRARPPTRWSRSSTRCSTPATRPHPQPRSPPAARRQRRPPPTAPRHSWRSPPAPPASPTPTWPPTRSSPRPRTPVSRCTSRRRARRAARRWTRRRSPAPTPSSSPPTSG